MAIVRVGPTGAIELHQVAFRLEDSAHAGIADAAPTREMASRLTC